MHLRLIPSLLELAIRILILMLVVCGCGTVGLLHDGVHARVGDLRVEMQWGCGDRRGQILGELNTALGCNAVLEQLLVLLADDLDEIREVLE